MSFPPHPIPEGMLRHSSVTPCRREGPPSIWDTHGNRETFLQIQMRLHQHLILKNCINGIHRLKSRSIRPHWRKVKARTKSRSEMPVWTVSQRFSHPQWRRLFKELCGRPTTTADFGSSFGQIPHTSYVCLLEDKIQDRGMYLFAISYGSDAMDQRSGDGDLGRIVQIKNTRV